MQVTAVKVPARDGYQLAGTFYQPAASVDRGKAVLLAPATAVRRRYYHAFASYLAEQGMAALTFDYRGIGDSRPRNLRGFPGAMRHWGEQDLAGAIDWLADHAAGRTLLAVGHSAGGQLIGLAANNHRLAALLTVGAQSGYWGFWPAPRKYAMWLLWSVLIPGLTRVFGYFPSRLLGLGPELPKGVALEWARWCRDPEFLNGRARPASADAFAGFTGPLRAYSFADDSFAPAAAVDWLNALYRKATVDRRHVTPAEIGLRAVGHFGFFRESCRAPLWGGAADWLLQH